MNPRVYVARKDCGCIVAAFPVNMDKAIKGELMKQFSKAGYDLEQTTQYDVRENYHLTCDHNRPPLLAMMDERTAEGRMAVSVGEGVGEAVDVSQGVLAPSPSEGEGWGEGQPLEEEHTFDENEGDDEEHAIEDETEDDVEEDDGADETDVNDLAGDISPEAEEADELLAQDEF